MFVGKEMFHHKGLLMLIFFSMSVLEAHAGSSLFWQDSVAKAPPLRIYAEFVPAEVLPGEVVTLTIRGFLEEGWHIYSIEPKEAAPTPTSVSYQSNEPKPLGFLQESSPQIFQDEALHMTLAVHQKEFVLRQQFKIAADAVQGEQMFAGTLHYHMCDNRLCTPQQHQSFTTPLTVQP